MDPGDGPDPACCVDPGDGGAKVLLTRTMLTESGGLILQDRPFPAAPYKQVFSCRRCRKGVFSFQNDAGDIEAESL